MSLWFFTLNQFLRTSQCGKTKNLLYTVWKNTIKRDHDFYCKINNFSAKSTFLLKKLQELISRNFLSVIAFFRIFLHCCAVTWKIFRENNLQLFSRNFCEKWWQLYSVISTLWNWKQTKLITRKIWSVKLTNWFNVIPLKDWREFSVIFALHRIEKREIYCHTQVFSSNWFE